MRQSAVQVDLVTLVKIKVRVKSKILPAAPPINVIFLELMSLFTQLVDNRQFVNNKQFLSNRS